jgi:hypothetical protein
MAELDRRELLLETVEFRTVDQLRIVGYASVRAACSAEPSGREAVRPRVLAQVAHQPVDEVVVSSGRRVDAEVP